MKRNPIRVSRIKDTGDARGSSFALPPNTAPFLANVKDLHLMTLRPHCVRGNHFHVNKHEILLVIYRGKWSLHWDTGLESDVQHRAFRGSGTVMCRVDPYASHAIRNDGETDLWIVAWSDREFDPSNPDIHRRVVV